VCLHMLSSHGLMFLFPSVEANIVDFPGSGKGSLNVEEACVSAIECFNEYENNRLLKPLKVRLRSLLKSVQEETESYAEIRQKFRERECERSNLKSRHRARVVDQHTQLTDQCDV